MPGDDGDAEWFAAADEQARPAGFVADPELARDLDIAAMLRVQGAALAPRADERARVRARVLAEIARQAGGPTRTGVSETVPFGRLLRPAFPTTPVPTAPAWADSLFTTATGGSDAVDPVASTLRLPSRARRAGGDRPPGAPRGTRGERALATAGVDTPGPDAAGLDTTQLPFARPAGGRIDGGHEDRGHENSGPLIGDRTVGGTGDRRATDDAHVGRPVGTGPHDGVPAAGADRRGRQPRHGTSNRPAARAGTGSRPATARRSLRSRAALAGATVVLAVLAVAGSVFASHDALPGETLYGIKRVAESVGDALTVGDAARAQRNLASATTRMSEVQTLVTRDPSTTNPALVQSTFQDFDSSTGAGSRAVLTSQDAGGPAMLATLGSWASDQAGELSALRTDLPPSTRSDADGTLELLDRLQVRTAALSARASCTDQTSATGDDLGPLPGTGACTPPPTVERAAPSAAASTVPAPVPGAAAPTPSGTSGPAGPTSAGAATPGAARRTTVRRPAASASPAASRTEPPPPTTRSRAPGAPLRIPLPRISVPPLPGFPGITVG